MIMHGFRLLRRRPSTTSPSLIAWPPAAKVETFYFEFLPVRSKIMTLVIILLPLVSVRFCRHTSLLAVVGLLQNLHILLLFAQSSSGLQSLASMLRSTVLLCCRRGSFLLHPHVALPPTSILSGAGAPMLDFVSTTTTPHPHYFIGANSNPTSLNITITTTIFCRQLSGGRRKVTGKEMRFRKRQQNRKERQDKEAALALKGGKTKKKGKSAGRISVPKQMPPKIDLDCYEPGHSFEKQS